MTHIADFYGKKNHTKIPPDMMPRDVAVQPLTRGMLSPAAQDTLASISEALNELDRLRSELSRVTTDLEVERRTNDEFRHMLDEERAHHKHVLDEERALKEYYQRDSIEMRTQMQTMADLANKANSRVRDGRREEKITQVEEAIEELVASEVSGKAAHG